jgi:antitoxin ParD1/3/4
MTKISISLPDELINYLDQKVEDKSIFIASILQQWRQQQEAEELAQACLAVDELELGWTQEWQTAAIIDLEASGL